jgi:hypothetical protein
MDNHEKYLKAASRYFDNELAGKALADFKAHLASCDTCAREIAFLESTRKSMQALPLAEAAPAVSQAVLQKAAQEPRIIPLFPKLSYAAAVAAVIAGLISGFFWYQLNPVINGTTQYASADDAIEYFDEAFPGSITETYIAMEESDEK